MNIAVPGDDASSPQAKQKGIKQGRKYRMSGKTKRARFLWRKSMRSFWEKSQWPVFVALIVLTVYLGYLGFAKHFAALNEKRSFWDLFYLSLQLFTLESGSIAGPKGWELELARLLAPSLAAFATIKALLLIFREKVSLLRLKLAKNHVVICGLGQKGLLLAQGFHDGGDRVVVIEKDEQNHFKKQCRESGVNVIIGDATRQEVLHSAKVHKAKYLISVSGDDGANAETAVQGFDLVKKRKGKPLSCFVHINDPQLCTFLREVEIWADETDPFELEFFSIYDSGARALLKDFPAFREAGQNGQPHVAIIGLGRMGRSVIVRAARMWKTQPDRGGKALSITIIDKEAKNKTDLLGMRYPQLRKYCELIPRQMDVNGPEFQDAAYLFDAQGSCRISPIYVCFDNDSLGLAAALTLYHRVRNKKSQIVVRMTQPKGLAGLVGKTTAGLSGFENIHVFGLLDRTCEPELILGGIHERIARALHESYVCQQEKLGQTVKTNRSLVPWDELPDSLKDSNRNQAHHLGVKLKTISCRIALLTDWDAELFAFTPEEIEILAKMEHERWMKDLGAQGWSYAEGEKNPKRKTHPYLVLWEELPEEIKEYDRNFVRELPKILAKIDLQVYRYKKS